MFCGLSFCRSAFDARKAMKPTARDSAMANPQAAIVESANRSSRAMMARMSAMMFLQYWPLGVWGVTVGTLIAANTGQQGERIFSAGFVGYSTAAGAVGSLLSPVLIGFLSDRY